MEIVEDAAGVRFREAIPRVIPVPNPAAGADWNINVTAGALWIPLSIRAQLVASAVVANRFPRLRYSDGSSVFYGSGVAAPATASTNFIYTWARGMGYDRSNGSGTDPSGGLPTFPIFGGFNISVSTASIDVADQWINVFVYVLEVEERSYDVELGMDLAALRGKMSNAYPSVREGL